MGVYTSQIAAVKRIIQAKGEQCVWETHTAALADATKPWIETEAGGSPTQNTAYIAFFPITRQFQQLVRFMRSTEVATGYVYGLMGAVAFEPKPGDVVVRKDGSKLTVVSVDPFAPNGDVILYTIEFTR